MHHSAVLSLTFCVLTAAAQVEPKPQFTARELFYSAATDSKPTPKPAAPAPSPKPAVVAKKQPVQAPPTQSAAVATASQPSQQTVSQPAAQSSQPLAATGGAQVVKTALITAPAPATGTPLGLKYTILRKSGDEMVEVPQDTVFHAGDRLQLSVQTNGPGYLYVISRGSSGTWTPMFPSPEVADGNNHVDGWNARVLPPGSRMVLDEQTGTEHVFIVFSRTPEDSLENMIYSLQDGAKAKPAAEKALDRPQKKFVMTAGVDIPDSAVGQLRDTYTRDLIIEKVDEKTPEDKSSANKKENAVYVVNPSGSSDSRVVADLKLEHR